ncbi:TBC1 domain family member 15-like isoform X2 [Liolophura sinensis]|uniref:TBC1 domain family member 15-like isoform X2 n=1 Tax=Liolophura sinensis TaxID=3198878 RepID=UPI00315852DA
MASDYKIIFEKDSVYIHTGHTDSCDDLLAGKVYLVQKAEGVFLEWRAEEKVYSLDGNSDYEWISTTVSFKADKGSENESVNVKQESRRKHNISFNILDLNSFKRSANTHTWAYLIFIMKDGTTYPALHFHGGGSKALLKEMERFVHLKRSTTDGRLYIVQEHDPEILSKSLDELQLLDTQGDLVTKFMRDPYSTTMGGFSKVTNFLRDTLLQAEAPLDRPTDELAEILNDDIPGMEINHQDEPGFELITKTKLPPRPDVKRSDPLTAQEWSKYMDRDGRVKDVEDLKKAIFRGGVESSIRIEVWKFLLNYYSWDSTYKSRTEERKKKVDDYFRMKLQWKTISAEQERRFSLLKERKGLIDKDVSRTDRNHKFFTGDKNPNLQVLYDILMTYCMYNFDLGYVQGMSDLLSPILVVMENEVDAFWCFVGFMEMVCDNFEMDQMGMKTQLAQTHTLMQFVDPDLCSYLEGHDSGNFYFCFRWLLIMFKREFTFPDIMRLWEVMWTEQPCKNFHLLICLAILDTEKTTLIENKFGFTEILKHINDMCFCIDLLSTLKKAEGMYLQLKACKKVPQAVKDILGFGGSASNSNSSSGKSTPANTPTNSVSNVKMQLPLKSASKVKENGTTTAAANGSAPGTAGTTPDDSSIEILPDVDTQIW